MKSYIIILGISMLTLSLYAQKSVDSLSLERAMQIALSNNKIDSQDSAIISKAETTLLCDVVLKYNDLQYYYECHNSIVHTKNKITGFLNENDHNATNEEAYNLNIQSILVDLEIQMIEYQLKISAARASLSEVLGVDGQEFVLTSPFESVYLVSDYNAKSFKDQPGMIRNKELYEHNVLLLQQMSIKRDLAEHQLNNTLLQFDQNYSELRNDINNFIDIQFGVFSRMLEMKKIFLTMTKLLAVSLE